ncbi:SubName: Full=Uncharacterized protein {ECO:0000313/EMBL:CCA70984.1} [Serendipita indica DSM 11827]|uniref:Uncharacterized protein n=1 Tax=Serendipita indica (strain DSM 11827) TaxID=1109443 RepID=G4TI41_SERID|nr:SubName: Full=Uncharacterized protein {ECO:0000313/EMBL:CCA70984.1} [Serendipita indica DSM 11827]CCA70984.1 hypothetical protein PIIN_04917 [Serendipita indica DSM 11827]
MALAVAVYSLSSRAAQNLTSITTECLPSCANQYRSLAGIVLSCLITVFLCIWVALHLNVPEPVDTRDMRYLVRFKIWIGSSFRCIVVPICVTLVFPEWVLGIAVLQFSKATRLAQKIRELQNGEAKVTRQHGFFILMGGFHLFRQIHPPSLNNSREEAGEGAHLLAKKSAAEAGDSRHDQTSSGKTSLVEEFGEPLHPLDEFDVFRLLKDRKLRLPTSAELQDKCKSDGLAKFLVVVQTLWFIAQCIARKVSKLPLTELEVITLGYTLLTVSMYIAWWDKPYRVTFPVRVYETLPERTNEQKGLKRRMEEGNFVVIALAHATGSQGELVDLRSVKRVPMFYSGYNETQWNVSNFASILTTIIVGTLFGAVHFLAWSSPFPSTHMQFLWRFAAIIMTAVPPAAAVGFILVGLMAMVSEKLGALILLPLLLLPPLYFVGRGITIVLALVTLATLPLDAYRDVEWSDIFPHI